MLSIDVQYYESEHYNDDMPCTKLCWNINALKFQDRMQKIACNISQDQITWSRQNIPNHSKLDRKVAFSSPIHRSINWKVIHSFVGLRDQETREDRLREIPSAYNYRLEPPACNVTTEKDARELFGGDYNTFLANSKRVKEAEGEGKEMSINKIHGQLFKIHCTVGEVENHTTLA